MAIGSYSASRRRRGGPLAKLAAAKPASALSVALALVLAAGAVVTFHLPARALLAPQPQLSWRLGYVWSFTEAAHGLDWGLAVRVPLQPSERGLVSLVSTLEGTGPGYRVGEWAFHIGGLVEPYRSTRAAYGLFYTLRDFGPAGPARGALAGLAFRVGALRAGIYPGLWNPGKLPAHETVAVVEPGWFAGLYVQLRWALKPEGSSLRLAFGIEEGW